VWPPKRGGNKMIRRHDRFILRMFNSLMALGRHFPSSIAQPLDYTRSKMLILNMLAVFIYDI
jgi:hypothetical protein